MQSPVVIVSNTFQSFDELCGQLRGVDLELIPLRAGPVSGRTKTLIGDSFIFTAGKFVSDHRFRGTTHESQILLGMHFGRNGTAYYQTMPGEVGDLTLHQPKHEDFGSMRGTYEYAALSIDPAELAGLADGMAGNDTILERSAHIRAPHAVADFASSSLAKLTEVVFDPVTLRSAARLEMLKRAVLYPYLLVAAHETEEGDSAAHPPNANIVRSAERWLDGEPPERLHVIDLCRALNLPLRTVQRAFHETLGMGPARYLAYYRLHKVRQALLHCDPTTTRVTDIALDQGFWELGRFAGLYRKTYGERPSETLRRRV